MNDQLNPEAKYGTYDEQEEPLPKAASTAEKLEFLNDALKSAKAYLEIAEAWALEFPEHRDFHINLNSSIYALLKVQEHVLKLSIEERNTNKTNSN